MLGEDVGLLGARQFVENHFANWSHTTWSMRRSVKYDLWSKKLVRYDILLKMSSFFFFDQTSYSMQCGIDQMSWIIKKRKSEEIFCLPDIQLIKARSNNFITGGMV